MSEDCVFSGPITESGPEAMPDIALVEQVCSEIVYEREAVAEIGSEAVRWVIYGEAWEFRGGAFYVTELFGDRRRQLVGERRGVPPGPWRHCASCGCEVCRLGPAYRLVSQQSAPCWPRQAKRKGRAAGRRPALSSCCRGPRRPVSDERETQ